MWRWFRGLPIVVQILGWVFLWWLLLPLWLWTLGTWGKVGAGLFALFIVVGTVTSPEPVEQGLAGGDDVTPSPSPTGEPSPTPEPRLTATPTQAATRHTEQPTEVAGAGELTGIATCQDQPGDVKDPNGNEASVVHRGTDLVEVRMIFDTDAIRVTWQANDDMPSVTGPEADHSIVWFVDLWQENTPMYNLAVDLIDDEWYVSVADWRRARHQQLRGEPVRSGNVLSAAYPMVAVEDLEPGFEWYSGVEWGYAAGYTDQCPEGEDARLTHGDS